MKLITPKIWFLLGLALYFSFLLIQFLTLKYNPTLFNISEFGSLGDFIAGFTAPIINIIAAILVYKSFQAQVTANKMQYDALKADKDFDRINLLLNDLAIAQEKIKLLSTSVNVDLKTKTGLAAIHDYKNYFQAYLDHNMYFGHYTNTPEFTFNYIKYLNIVSLTSSYLIKYYKKDDISYTILRNKLLELIGGFYAENGLVKLYEHFQDDNELLNIVIHIKPIIPKIDAIIANVD